MQAQGEHCVLTLFIKTVAVDYGNIVVVKLPQMAIDFAKYFVLDHDRKIPLQTSDKCENIVSLVNA